MKHQSEYTRAELREAMRHTVNRERKVADELAQTYDGCDDPLYPWGPQVFRDWIDFTKRVCFPLVEADGDEKIVQAAMKLYRKESPYAICVSLVFAYNRIKMLEDKLEAEDVFIVRSTDSEEK